MGQNVEQIYLTNLKFKLFAGCYKLHKTKSSGSIPHIIVNLIHLFAKILFISWKYWFRENLEEVTYGTNV